jgi:hypothetical protein
VALSLEARDSLEAFASHVKTKDEHKKGDESVRSFPTRIEKPYVWDILDTFVTEPIVGVEKSRQLLLTWQCCMYSLWTAKYQKNRLVFVQSKKEENAAVLVYKDDPNKARISFIESNLPKEMQEKPEDIKMAYGEIYFSKTGSTIKAVPEGGDQIRSFTPSLVFSDESAFQPEFRDAWKAIKPCIDGGGQFIFVSTAKNGSFMKDLIRTVGMVA